MEERVEAIATTIVNDKPQVGLNEASRKRLDEFRAQISQISDRGYLRLYDSQTLELTFNLNKKIELK